MGSQREEFWIDLPFILVTFLMKGLSVLNMIYKTHCYVNAVSSDNC